MLQEFMESLPCGSGIDADWNFSLHKDSIRFYNSFHCMGESGVYDGWSDFVVVVSKNMFLKGWYRTIANSFDLQFQGKESQRLAKRYDLRHYLEDTFADFFRGL